MTDKQLMEKADHNIMGAYARFPLALVRGQGMRVWDADGRMYLDFLAGIAVMNLGHCHPAIARAVAEQAERLIHVSNLYYTSPQTELSALLTNLTFADKVFFCNSGAEANEGAIKLARKYHYDRGDGKRRKIVSALQSFHGRTLATLTATGQDKVKTGFAPLPEGFEYVPYDDPAALGKAVGDDTVAVILEPVQGEGGVRLPSPGYLAKAREISSGSGALLIFDEVQTGMGRTGTFLACEGEEVSPDIATLAKGLGGGLPIGAVLATDAVAASFTPGSHASTFGGNPICAAAATAALGVLINDGVMANCREMGAYLVEKLQRLASSTDRIAAVRGRGLLIGLELKEGLKAADLVRELMDEGFLTGTAGEGVLRLAPPLIVTRQEIDALISAFEHILLQ